MYVLGKILDPESLNIEYKEFRLEIEYTKTNYYNIISDLKYLRNLFKDVLIKSLNKYICKYSCSFFNSSIDGVLKIGVSDIGEVIGIPIYKSDIINTIYYIREIITSKLKESILDIDHESLYKDVDIKLYKINKDNYIYFDYFSTDEYVNELEKQNKQYKDYKIKYLLEKKRFITQLEMYRRSINTVINDPYIREEFRNYLKENKVYDIFKDFIKDDIFISFTNEEIKKYKHFPSSIVYWITIFRDLKTDSIINSKPKWDYSMKPIDVYYRLLQDFKPLIPNLYSKGFDMYILEIKFNFSESQKDKYISFVSGDEIRTPIRSFSPEGAPCCIY